MQPFGDRPGLVIEPMLSDQWYVDAKTLAQKPLEAVKSGAALHDRDVEILLKSGGSVRARLSLVPLVDENRVVGAVATLRVDDTAPTLSA